MGIIIKLPGITRKWPGIIIIFGGGHGNTLVYFGIMITNSAKLGIIKVISPWYHIIHKSALLFHTIHMYLDTYWNLSTRTAMSRGKNP